MVAFSSLTHRLKALVAVILAAFFAASAQAQSFPDQPNWVAPSAGRPTYPLFFIAAERYIRMPNLSWKPRAAHPQGLFSASPRSESTAYGTDVSTFQYPTSSAYLFVLLTNGTVRQVFPLNVPQHLSAIDRAYGAGAVLEPRMSLDAEWIYFSYAHDVTDGNNKRYGSDLYRIHVKPLLENPSVDPATLPLQRITTQNAPITNLDNQMLTAINPIVSRNTHNLFGGLDHLGAVEIATEAGTKLVYASNKLRFTNSIFGRGDENFSLFSATIAANGTLTNDNRYQSYITSSAVSPVNMRNGLSFSYNTGIDTFGRKWEVQWIKNDQFHPLHGFGGSSAIAFHNHTACGLDPNDTTGVGDYFISSVYYHAFNNGFGALRGMPLRPYILGEAPNVKYANGGHLTLQKDDINMTIDVDWNQDEPSRRRNGVFVGKYSTPACGNLGELFAAYTQSCANTRSYGACPEALVLQDVYRSHIVRRDLAPGPQQPFDPLDPNATRVVVDDTNDFYSLIWPTPAVPMTRQGSSGPRRFASKEISRTVATRTGEPIAYVGTSSLDHTDGVPVDCRIGARKFKPSAFRNDVNNELTAPMAFLSRVRDRGNMASTCDTGVLPENVLGVNVLLTEHNIDQTRRVGTTRQELTKLLGFVDVRGNPNNDTSFAALVPAEVPYKLELIDRETGFRLLDQRNWKSQPAGDIRFDCGGCHEHTKPGRPWEGTYAATPNYPVQDLTRTTPYIDYNAQCQPVVKQSSTATLPLDVWGDNTYLFTKFRQYCQDCHQAGGSGANAFVITTAAATYTALNQHNSKYYIYPLGGANSSPVVWAARGRRLDGRDNSDPYYAPDFRFSEIHADPSAHANTARCDKNDLEYAQWVYRLGRWVDNYAPTEAMFPQNNGGGFNTMPFSFDRFPPTAAAALVDGDPVCGTAGGLRVGFWDDTGGIAQVSLRYPNGQIVTRTPNGSALENPFEIFPLTGVVNSSDQVVIEVRDTAGNRATLRKTLAELQTDCVVGRDPRLGRASPGGSLPGGGEPGNGQQPGGAGDGGISFTASLSSAAAGEPVDLEINAPGHPGKQFIVLASNSGGSSEVVMGSRTLALGLIQDALFSEAFSGARGTLDAEGRGTFRVWVRADQQVGVNFAIQVVVLDTTTGNGFGPSAVTQLAVVSNANSSYQHPGELPGASRADRRAAKRETKLVRSAQKSATQLAKLRTRIDGLIARNRPARAIQKARRAFDKHATRHAARMLAWGSSRPGFSLHR